MAIVGENITDELDQIHASKDQLDFIDEFRGKFQLLYRMSKQIENRMEQVIAGTKFDEVPTHTKQSMNKFRQALINFNAAVNADADMVELVTWSEQVENPPMDDPLSP